MKVRRGPIAWMAQNTVAANLLMGIFIVGGLLVSGGVKQEVFPEFTVDEIHVSSVYPGASPSEVEKGVLIAMEEAVRALDGVKEVISVAGESSGLVRVRLENDADNEQALSDVRGAIDRLRSMPIELERPIVKLVKTRQRSVSVIVYGDVDHELLRRQAEYVRAGLVANTLITQAELKNLPLREIAIEITEENQRKYNITPAQIAQKIRASSIELPSGQIKSSVGELLIRTSERREIGEEFENIAVIANPDGSVVRLGEIATVNDGFEEDQREAWFNGKPSVLIDVYRVGNQKPLEITDAITQFLAKTELPVGIEASLWSDRSTSFVGRINLLKSNAISGLILVFVALGLFLEIRLAFWVMLGIPISFLGAFLFIPMFDASINMVSMFAFILVLGIVVDDAIVVGENVFRLRNEGKSALDAAIEGAKEVSTPVFFAVATTVATFGPLLFVPGFIGKIFGVIPIIVIATLTISWIESVYILPAHLAHSSTTQSGVFGWIITQQLKVSRFLERFIANVYTPSARLAAEHRYTTVALSFASLLLLAGAIKGGAFKFSFMPKLESDNVVATIRLPLGTPLSETKRYRDLLESRLRPVLKSLTKDKPIHLGVLSVAGGTAGGGGGPRGGTSGGKSTHVASVRVMLVPLGEREFSSGEVARAWRKSVGEVVGAELVSFGYTFGGGGGEPVNIRLSHPDIDTLEQTSVRVAKHLEKFDALTDIDTGFSLGKEQLNVKLSDQGRALGITERALANTLRASFYGTEALRQQRGRDEVRVIVRRPRADRTNRDRLENMMLQTPGGMSIPLKDAALFESGRAYSSIYRVNGRRAISVTADLDSKKGNANEILGEIQRSFLPKLVTETPGLTYSLEGERKSQKESLGALAKNYIFALLIIFCLLAIPFKSYAQPFLVMSAIPFGAVGALLGHWIMGFELSIMSMMGIVALSGVVVNDSLVLMIATNKIRRSGSSAIEAAVQGAALRFRPILLTSLTTSFGLAPMILEKSVQARFLVPMAVSLGFGILWATIIILYTVPSFYLILDDVQRFFQWLYGKKETNPDHLASSPAPGEDTGLIN
ncbi:MAG: efflux RND transporter permease subunit [Bradymonadia bacterium]